MLNLSPKVDGTFPEGDINQPKPGGVAGTGDPEIRKNEIESLNP